MTFEIIPNWHPIFVHFTVALFSVATALFLVERIFLKTSEYKERCLLIARCNLWIGSVITIGTILAGWYAYNTVSHDAPSHAAMTLHRNWALSTASLIAVMALWAFISRNKKDVSISFMLCQIITSLFLLVTAYLGGEAVYRYGLGVISLPQSESNESGHGGHSHQHHDEGDAKNSDQEDKKSGDLNKRKIHKKVIKNIPEQINSTIAIESDEKKGHHNHNHKN
jgi:uncharacterized membrane protein